MSISETAKPARAKRRWLFIPWVLFLAIVIGWIGYWFVVADAAEHNLGQWSAAQRTDGGEFTFARVVRHGFPVLMRLEIDTIRYQGPNAHWSAETPEADLNIELLDPGHVILEYKAPITITHADGATNTLSADTMVASMHNNGPVLIQDGVEASNLSVTDSAKPGVTHVVHVTANVRPDPSAANQYQLAFLAQGVTLARAVRGFEGFGQTIASLDAGVVIEQGAALIAPSRERDALKPWLDAGGKARFDYLALSWGALEAHGAGEVSLDPSHRLAGDLRLELAHAGLALEAFSHSASLSRDAKQAIDAMALGLALRNHNVRFKLEAADGQLRLQGAPVRSLDPLY